MQIETRMFGTIDVDESTLVHFPAGLVGFEELRSYALVEAEELKPVTWLLPVDDPDLAFPLCDPGFFVKEYEVPVSGEDRDVLDVDTDDEVVILTVVTLPQGEKPLTANLRGPIVINLTNRIGRQVILLDERYSHRQASLAEQASAAVR
jgi:flagellar assembly factor FliW